ncbi:MAG TPA: acetyl-CoA C-acyltransferase [Chitinophagales bacterium]|nr:acetyl-CoA C-acyltransferase [Chitinophagales bacterium]
MNEVYIVSVARTPIGSMSGVLSQLTAVQLGTQTIKKAIERAGITGNDVEEVIMGNVIQANTGQAPARQAAIAAGVHVNATCTTVNKVCASGMKAIILGAQSIMLGDKHVVVAGGMESMTNAPYMMAGGRGGYRYGNAELLDSIVRDALQDPYTKEMMGNSGDRCAKKFNFTREDQDAFALESYRRAAEAYKNGHFSDELFDVEIAGRGESTFVKEDEEYKKLRADKVATLKPAFGKDGTVTAVNASKINDGAAAVVLMSGQKVKELGLKPIAKLTGYGDAEQAPDDFTTSPALAMPKALAKAGKDIKDVDYFEINEAFSNVTMANTKLLGLDPAKVNVFGGAVSLGHPVGASGARIIVTLLSVLKHKGGKTGCAGICNGGGGASAVVVELV